MRDQRKMKWILGYPYIKKSRTQQRKTLQEFFFFLNTVPYSYIQSLEIEHVLNYNYIYFIIIYYFTTNTITEEIK